MSKKLEGKTAVITGGTEGIGLATAKLFVKAGVAEFVPCGAVSEEHFDKLFNINVRGALFTVQKALPLLKDGGSIILNGSVASVKGTAAFGVYAASKAAIRSFVRTWTTD